ncbi:hypothetical protein MA3A0930S_1168 [Mycobacteroides abscessus 3A-0930-S]|nr:hypothetical protein MA3A0119R_1521 [Mycobacteroides abscessus 3A-0119-R]EIV34190.1 hypothetical protein MA3A0122R_1548 [Mycobacteroides abscessus 3A-0122-R]EIV41543.1 hypothetical protein MA3A0122S_1112 [Mycobacteroides abscessus 3A-0122-S]EIV55681.1 hypothetical protein MA3A0930S_1168 [Mycobacteroides abscessus 3A-0930-S]EIV56998.1 hypothetical protein MA3A0930R_1608 [Mycobacteroides abscessus 3A-0930-R]EIV83024.1 hypothetical protein MM3A0810R_1603 [Mycobacteroides abscessus 3A-0810-R]
MRFGDWSVSSVLGENAPRHRWVDVDDGLARLLDLHLELVY